MAFKSRKFRVDILTIFITLYLTSILGITGYFYSRSNDAVLKVANGLISRTLDSISQKMDDFLQPTPLFGIANLIMNDLKLNEADMDALASYMHVVLNAYPQLVNAYIADIDGNLFIENRITAKPLSTQFIPFIDKTEIPSQARFLSAILTRINAGESAEFIYKNEFGSVIKKTKMASINFDPRSRPWYVNAKQGGKSKWISMYSFYKMDAQVLTIAFPIYVKNRFMGVAAADLSINSIREAINKLSIDAKGVVFIANNNGRVIAHQKMTPEDDKANTIETIENINNPLIKTAYSLYSEKKVNVFTFKMEGITYIAHFKTYSISGNEKWEIAAIIPIAVFVGSISEANKNVLIFLLLTLMIGLILVVISSNKISRPIIELAAETQEMRHLNFEQKTHIHSYIYEVQVMVTALNIAKSALFSFAKYVPRTLVEQLLKVGTIAKLGGEKKKITVLFSDINHFTSISENMDPNFLMLHLSEYLNVLTTCVHRHHGNIDKYIGDSIMAFWGAPQNDERQVYHACLALLDCQRESRRLCQISVLQGKPTFTTRFGLNMGSAIVGNLGSSDRLNYTVIGDTVNTASRLEKINKLYETEIIVSEIIFFECQNEFLFRPIDIVSVIGRSKPIEIFELISETKNGQLFPATNDQIQLCSVFTEAYRLFHSKEYKQSFNLFTDILKQFPDDKITKIYIKRCLDLV